MKNFKIGIKMTLGIGILLMLIILNGGLSIRSLTSIDKEVSAVADIYLPLDNITTQLQGELRDIPGFMNLYMLNSDTKNWQSVDANLKSINTLFPKLQAMTDRIAGVDTRMVDEGQKQYAIFEKALRDTFTANQSFVQNRVLMVSTGGKVGNMANEYLALVQKRLQEAVNAMDTTGIQASFEQFAVASSLANGLAESRIRMLRSLAERNNVYAKDNLTKIFPQILADIKTLEKYTAPQFLKLLEPMRATVEEFRGYQSAMLQLWEQTDELNLVRVAARSKALASMQEVAKTVADFQNLMVQDVAKESGTSISTNLTSVAIVVLLGLILGVLLTRSITGPMGKAVAFAQAVAGGDLRNRLHLGRRDEIGQLADSLDIMVDSLNEKIIEANAKTEEAAVKGEEARKAMEEARKAQQLAETAKRDGMIAAADRLESVVNIVSSASTQLAAQIEQSERGASEQASRVTETATAMEEMNVTVLEVAKNAGEASDISTSTRLKAEAGAEIVSRAVASIQQVQQQSVQLKEDMTQLDENARAINQIMGVISDIADQTNLLALNAAIEAARAGEAGRGFAVVADEVRKLAEKTMASTTDVGNAIRAIQTSTRQSMAQVDTSAQSIEEATEYANQSGAALREIVSMVDQTADQVRAIATASEQQSASSEEINQSITQVNSIAGETARAMQEAAHAVSDLAGQAQVLTSLIDDMKRG